MDFTALQVLGISALVFLAGFIDSIAGGGGLISLPAYFAIGLPPHAALATNKFSSSCGTFAAVLGYWRAGIVRVRVGLIAAAGALAGAVAGTKLALMLSPRAINTMMLALVPAVLVFVLLEERIRPRLPVTPRAGPGADAVALGIGAVIGVYDGLFGPGTGTFLTIAFSVFLGLDLLGAAGNARLANLASNLGSVAVFLLDGRVVFPLAFAAAGAGVAGNLLGARLALRKGARIIRPLMVVVLVLLLAEVVRRRWF